MTEIEEKWISGSLMLVLLFISDILLKAVFIEPFLEFVLKWKIYYVFVMMAMSIDNIFWIPTSPEFKDFKKWKIAKKLRYVIGFRIFSVITHPLDIIPALMTSYMMALLL